MGGGPVWQSESGRAGGWRPEVDFIELCAMAQQIEPVAIGYSDEGFHWKTPNSRSSSRWGAGCRVRQRAWPEVGNSPARTGWGYRGSRGAGAGLTKQPHGRGREVFHSVENLFLGK